MKRLSSFFYLSKRLSRTGGNRKWPALLLKNSFKYIKKNLQIQNSFSKQTFKKTEINYDSHAVVVVQDSPN